MRLDSIPFLLLAFAAILASRLAGGRLRLVALGVASAIFLATFSTSPLSLAPILGFVLLGYGAVLAAARMRIRGAVGILVCGLVLGFVWLKHYSIILPQLSLSTIYATVGLSYVLFRVLHLVIDVGQGARAVPGPFSYLHYIFFFLSFSSGPVQRYQDFQTQIEAPPPPLSVQEVTAALNRISWGYFLLTFVDVQSGWVFEKLAPRFLGTLSAADISLTGLVLSAATAPAFMLHVYINFSAYMHIVIGIGKLLGMTLPENFDRPLLAGNFLGFWTRWHITLSEWFRDYVFNPLLKALFEFPRLSAHAPYTAAIAFFTTFWIIGLWHGSSFAFVVLGFLFGLGASVNKIWQTAMSARMGSKHYKALTRHNWYFQVMRAITLSYIAISLTCVWISPVGLDMLISRRGIVVAGTSMVVLTLVGIVLGFSWQAVGRIRVPRIDATHRPVLAAAWTGLIIFVVLNLALAVNAAPDIVYKDF